MRTLVIDTATEACSVALFEEAICVAGDWRMLGRSHLADLETLYDLVHDEVEDTALDVAAALRTSRQGHGMLGRVRRLLVPSRR